MDRNKFLEGTRSLTIAPASGAMGNGLNWQSHPSCLL
jgi:hypothetical protein